MDNTEFFGSIRNFKENTLIRRNLLACVAAAIVQEAPLKISARGVVSYFYFSRTPRPRALKIRQINSAILKVPDGALSC
jgi:hypothetical protein